MKCKAKCQCKICKQERIFKAIFGPKTDTLIAQEIARERAVRKQRRRIAVETVLIKIVQQPSRQFKFN